MIIYLFVFIALLAIDQVTKLAAYKYLRTSESKVIIKDFLELGYVENRGAAFGILQGKSMLFAMVTVLVCGFLLYYLYSNYSALNQLYRLSIVLVITGAIGNLIDRLLRGYVIDFISLRFWGYYDFPLFNVADMAVVTGACLLMVLLLIDEKSRG